MNDQLEE